MRIPECSSTSASHLFRFPLSGIAVPLHLQFEFGEQFVGVGAHILRIWRMIEDRDTQICYALGKINKKFGGNIIKSLNNFIIYSIFRNIENGK